MARAWEVELRERFPATRSTAYLNSASAGPLTLETARAGCEVYESMLGGGDAEWPAFQRKMDEARFLLADLAGCEKVELAFTRNTSHSASLVADMLWEAGYREAVAMEDEFPASTLPFLNRGFHVRFVAPKDGQYVLEEIDAALPKGGVLISSHVMYRTGAVVDPLRLGEIARAKSAHFVLCSTQSLGALRVNFKASGASFLLGTSHKWLCAGYGAGYLGIRKDLLGTFRWPAVGWLSQRKVDALRNDTLDLLPEARALEMGCANFPSMLALAAALQQWLDFGPERVEQRIRMLTGKLRGLLRAEGFDVAELPPEALSGITVAPIPHAEAVSDFLTEQRVAQIARGVGIRFGVHAFNNEADLDRAVKALVEARSRLRT